MFKWNMHILWSLNTLGTHIIENKAQKLLRQFHNASCLLSKSFSDHICLLSQCALFNRYQWYPSVEIQKKSLPVCIKQCQPWPLVLPTGKPECPYIILKPKLCIHIRKLENESKLKELWIIMGVILYFSKWYSKGKVYIYSSTVIINSGNTMPSDLMIVFFHKIEICLAMHVPGKWRITVLEHKETGILV